MLSNLFIKPMILLIAQVLPFWVAYRAFFSLQAGKKLAMSLKKEIIATFFFIYVVALTAITLYPYPAFKVPRPDPVNVIPFSMAVRDVNDILKTNTLDLMLPHLIENFVGNVIMFIPLGLCLPIFFQGLRSTKKMLMAAMLTSLTIEILQYFLSIFHIYRSTDIDDVILNTMGGLIGYLIFIGLRKSFNKLQLLPPTPKNPVN